MKWPNLFIVGAPRSGTTSLWFYLSQHPEIFMSRLKEPHFFSSFTPRHSRSVKDEEAYLKLFESGAWARWRGEASPSYLRDVDAPARIKVHSPDARIVVSLREPAERMYSDYWHRVRAATETRSFLDVVRAEATAPSESWPKQSYIGRSLYAEGLERYLATFGDAVLVLLFDDFAEDPRREMRRVFEFVEVDPSFARQLDGQAHNRFSLPRGALVKRLYARRALRSFGEKIVPRPLVPLVDRVLLVRREKPHMEPEAREILRTVFEPERPHVERLLGRSLPW